MNRHREKRALTELFRREEPLPLTLQAALRRDYDQIRLESRGKEIDPMRKTKRKHIKIGLAAAAAAVLLIGTALAVGLTHEEFFRSVFGGAVSAHDGYSYTDSVDGKTYEMPAVEKSEVDAQAAETLLGGAVADEGTVVQLGGYTFTINSWMRDESGIGCISYTVENPGGLTRQADGGAGTASHAPFSVAFTRAGDDLAFLDDKDYPDESQSTDTKMVFVSYLTPSAEPSGDDRLAMHFLVWEDGAQTPLSTSVTLSAADPAETSAFSGRLRSAKLSPIGLALTFEDYAAADAGAGSSGAVEAAAGADALPTPQAGPALTDPQIHDLRLVFADGSEYVLQSDEPRVYNLMNASTDGRTVWLSFNRLVDASGVVSITVDGTTLTPAA